MYGIVWNCMDVCLCAPCFAGTRGTMRHLLDVHRILVHHVPWILTNTLPELANGLGASRDWSPKWIPKGEGKKLGSTMKHPRLGVIGCYICFKIKICHDMSLCSRTRVVSGQVGVPCAVHWHVCAAALGDRHRVYLQVPARAEAASLQGSAA